MKRFVSKLALVVGFLAPQGVWADEGNPEVSAEDAAIDRAVADAENAALNPPAPLQTRKDKALVLAPPVEGLGLGTKLGLCAVVGGAVFWLVRARLAARTAKNGGRRDEKPRVLSRTSIGMRHEVVIVDIEGQRFVLGVAPGAVSSLGLLPDEMAVANEAAEDVPQAMAPAPAPTPPRGPSPTMDDDRDRDRERERERDRAPIADGISRLLAATRIAEAKADRRSPLGVPLTTEIRERNKAVRSFELDETVPVRARGNAIPRRKVQRALVTANDTLPEGQVRGLSARRAES